MARRGTGVRAWCQPIPALLLTNGWQKDAKAVASVQIVRSSHTTTGWEGRGASDGMPHYVRCTSPWPPILCCLRGVMRWNQKQSPRALKAASGRTKRSDVGMVAFGVGFTQVAYCSTRVSMPGCSMLQKQ